MPEGVELYQRFNPDEHKMLNEFERSNMFFLSPIPPSVGLEDKDQIYVLSAFTISCKA